MLADPRWRSARQTAQWLNLRRVAEVVVDPETIPLRLTLMAAQAPSCLLAARCATIAACSNCADYTFVNEKPRGITAFLEFTAVVSGVSLPTNQRGGLLAQGALLSTTSYPDRTSPVLRGNFYEQHLRAANRAAAAGGRYPAPPKAGRPRPSAAPCGTSHQSHMRELPWCDRSARICAESSTSSAAGARPTRPAGRCGGHAMGGANVEGCMIARASPGARGPVSAHGDRETARVCASAGSSITIVPPSAASCDAEAQNFRWSALILGIVKVRHFR